MLLTQGLLGRYDLLSLVASRIFPTNGSTAIILPCRHKHAIHGLRFSL
jgi:hypothetical protein